MYTVAFTVDKKNMKQVLEEKLTEFYTSLTKMNFDKAVIMFQANIQHSKEDDEIEKERSQKEKEEVLNVARRIS